MHERLSGIVSDAGVSLGRSLGLIRRHPDEGFCGGRDVGCVCDGDEVR